MSANSMLRRTIGEGLFDAGWKTYIFCLEGVRKGEIALGADMRTVLSRNTESVEPPKRLHFWREAMNESVVRQDARPRHADRFYSRMDLCRMRHLIPHQAWGSPQAIQRSQFDISHSEKSAYYLITQPGLHWCCTTLGADRLVKPGESVLVDTRIPYVFDFGHGLEVSSVELPINWVERWIAHPLELVGRPIAAESGWGRALRGFKEALTPAHLADLSLPDELIEDQLGVLLSLASATECAGPVYHELFNRCVAALKDQMATPGLVAAEIADLCDISPRTLHRTFAANGCTFAGVLMKVRIDEGARLLGDRRFHALTIGEVGRRCGFLDGSHFARQFRRFRNVGPREFRRAAGR